MVVDCGGGRWLWVVVGVVVVGSGWWWWSFARKSLMTKERLDLVPFHHQEISLLEGELRPPLWHNYL